MATIVLIVVGDIFSILAPYWYKLFFDEFAGSPTVTSLVQILIIIAVLKIAHAVCIWCAFLVNSHFQTSVMRDLVQTCFAYVHKHSISFFQNNFVGSIVKRINRYPRSFEVIADQLTWNLFPIVLNVGLIVVVLSTRNIWLGIAVFVWTLLFSVFNYYFSLYKLKYDLKRSQLDTSLTAQLADTITNNSNVKLFNGFFRETASFNDLANKKKKIEKFTWDLGTLSEVVVWSLMIILEIGLMGYAIYLWSNGVLTVGDFILIQTYIVRVAEKMWGFGRIIRDFYEGIADANEMTEMLLMPHEISDTNQAKKLLVETGEIIFDKVGFEYNKTRTIFHDLSLTIRAKEKIAFVGHSGAGKSTIIKLLLRNHDVTKGKILIDGQKISHVTLESLWEQISYVPQDPILFHRTLMENIRYARPEATNDEVVQAAKAAHAHEFITELSEGYDTYVGERGVKLSGGERQRVAIARAILKNAPILILDEATSSLDSESEQLIQDALEVLMRDKTVIVIAHRLSTIMKMDRILVMDGGDIIEEGTHRQLLRKKFGVYKKLWDIQAGDFLGD